MNKTSLTPPKKSKCLVDDLKDEMSKALSHLNFLKGFFVHKI